LLDDKDTMPMIAEVANNKFEFTVVKKDKFDLRTLCLTVDSIDRMALVSEKKGFSSQNSRLIAMEDLTIAIGLDLPGAIVKGGPANIEVDEMFKALHSKDFDKFFKDHSDSQISLLLLRSLIRLTEISSDFSYPCTTYFGTLSGRLKATPEGQTVKALLTK
jgi:putative NADH-flavin reductase